jgi:hypothetical protein
MKGKRFFTYVLIVLALAAATFACDFELEEKETITKNLSFAATAKSKTVTVDNVFGSIDVTGYDGQQVQVVIHKTIKADDENDIEKAKEEVTLEISEKDDEIEFYVDGPFRCKDGSVHFDRWREDYCVVYDFELKIPADVSVKLRTINDGDITVRDVTGDFDVENINGGVVLQQMSGSGRVYALNEDVDVTFKKNPESKSYFGSLNGEVLVAFQKDLSADFQLKTFNGDIYTDFPVTYLPRKDVTKEKRKGKYLYKSGQSMLVRVGKGGPEFTFDGFNGDIRITQVRD